MKHNSPGILRLVPATACRRFPAAVLAAALITGWFLCDIWGEWEPWERWDFGSDERLLILLSFAFASATTAGLLTERINQPLHWLLQGLGFLFGLTLGYVYRNDVIAVGFLTPAFVCAVSLAAGYAAGGEMPSYWRANARFALVLATGLVAISIAALGLLIISDAAEGLLGFDLSKGLGTLIAVGYAFVLPVFCLERAWLNGAGADGPHENALLRIVAVLTDLILIPLVIAFGIVIHIYAARIAYLGQMPKGEIGWVVPFYLISGYALMLMIHGLEAKLPRLRDLLCRTWFPSTFVPLVLLGLAIWLRIEAYGITEERYALVLIVVAGVLLAVSALIRRPFDIRLVPLIAGSLAFIAAIGPLNARSTTIRSQLKRAGAILSLVPPDGWTNQRDDWLDAEKRGALRSALFLLQRRDAAESLLLSPAWPSRIKTTEELEKLLIAKAHVTQPETLSFHSRVIQVGRITIFDIEQITTTTKVRVAQTGITYEASMSGNVLEFATAGEVIRFDLSPLLTLDKDVRRMPVLDSTDGHRRALAVHHFERERNQDKKFISEIRGKVVLY